MKTFEIEITRNNVTPAEFLRYVRNRVDAKGGAMLRSDLDTTYFAAGNDLSFDIRRTAEEVAETANGCIRELSVSRPYEMQTFCAWIDGTKYNEICEFSFDDEKTGHGYYYLINVYADDDAQPAQDAETETETINQTNAENAAEGAQEEENTMNENNETKTALDENTAHCKHIAQDIERIADGVVYTCPECGEMVTMIETEDADGFTVYELSCGHTVEYEPDSVTFCEYFSDVYDIEYRIGGGREYRSVKLMVACGGPDIYIDTARRAVLLYWWTDRAEYPISSTAADEIDNVFSEIFEC